MVDAVKFCRSEAEGKNRMAFMNNFAHLFSTKTESPNNSSNLGKPFNAPKAPPISKTAFREISRRPRISFTPSKPMNSAKSLRWTAFERSTSTNTVENPTKRQQKTYLKTRRNGFLSRIVSFSDVKEAK